MTEAKSEGYSVRTPPATACFEEEQRDHESRNAGDIKTPESTGKQIFLDGLQIRMQPGQHPDFSPRRTGSDA